MNKPVLIAVIVLALIVAAGVVLYFTTDVFKGVINQGKESSNSNAKVSNVLTEQTAGWKKYESPAGFSFKYPAEYSEYDFDQLLGLHSPEDNTDSLNFVMPQSCYDKLSAFFNANTNLAINANMTDGELFGDKCAMLDVSKESAARKTEQNSWMLSNTNAAVDETASYQFAGMQGTLTSSAGKQNNIDYYEVNLSGNSGDYIFTISLSAYGTSKDEAMATVKGIAQTMVIDQTKLTEADLLADKDGDGLIDQNEKLFGTNANLADTDSDGYNDQAEVSNCYNPTGTGKMTGQYFVDYCTAYIAASPLVSIAEFNNREALCAAWQPIAEDFINDKLTNIVLYEGWYDDYPQACATVDSLMGEKHCSTLRVYLSSMCLGKG